MFLCIDISLRQAYSPWLVWFAAPFGVSAPGLLSKQPSQNQQKPQKTLKKAQNPQSPKIDTEFYTNLTDTLLDQFYPKYCCDEKLTLPDGKRDTILRYPECHKQQSKFVATPLNHMKTPRWMFSYLLKESQLQFPKVLTTTEISKRVAVSYPTALKLKRRIQLFASDVVRRMQRRFYQGQKTKFAGFRFPKDKNTDLTELVKDLNVPNADTVVLYSCGSAANKGRKRFKRRGQTSSIYMSESLGGKQRGTLVNTLAVKNGPVFYDSIPNSQAKTVNPIIQKYIPFHNPIFTDEGYSLTSMNHRKVNHSRKSADKRFKWARNRFSKNGIHNNVAESRNGILKRGFSAYGWIDPKHSNLYLSEFSFFSNLGHFSVEDLLPDESRSNRSQRCQLDGNWALRGSFRGMLPELDGLRTGTFLGFGAILSCMS
jgi:transposase-like protein